MGGLWKDLEPCPQSSAQDIPDQLGALGEYLLSFQIPLPQLTSSFVLVDVFLILAEVRPSCSFQGQLSIITHLLSSFYV